jgi:hypothetical protein
MQRFAKKNLRNTIVLKSQFYAKMDRGVRCYIPHNRKRIEVVYSFVKMRPESGLPDFSWYTLPKRGNNNFKNSHKINQMSIKYSNIFHCKTQKITKICFFGMKIYHPAILARFSTKLVLLQMKII